MKKLPELSIFFPFWNEEKNIEAVVKRAIPVAENVAEKWEIIMVDDGSDDKTRNIAERLASADPRLIAVSHYPNRGYGGALKSGFEKAKYNFVVFTDGDGQFDFSEASRLMEKLKDADMVIGYRKRRRDNSVRWILMKLLKVWDLIFFRFYFRDIDCGFKLFTRSALDKIMPLKSEGAMVSTEILAKAKRAKLKISQAEVSHYPRKFGDQSGANVRVILRAILESFNLWYELRYERKASEKIYQE